MRQTSFFRPPIPPFDRSFSGVLRKVQYEAKGAQGTQGYIRRVTSRNRESRVLKKGDLGLQEFECNSEEKT